MPAGAGKPSEATTPVKLPPVALTGTWIVTDSPGSITPLAWAGLLEHWSAMVAEAEPTDKVGPPGLPTTFMTIFMPGKPMLAVVAGAVRPQVAAAR